MITFNHQPFPNNSITCKRSSFGGKRWYDVIEDEKIIHRFPSITTVLSTEEKPYISEWKKRIGTKKAAKETKRCQDRGEAVHLMIEKYLQNDPTFKDNHETSNLKIFNQMKTVLNKIDNVRSQESYLYSTDLKIAGTVDCIADFKGKPSIIDFKVANRIRTPEQIEDYFIQATAYALMCYETHNIGIENLVIIMGVEKGAILPVVYERNIEDYIKPLIKKIDAFYADAIVPQV